MPNPLSKLVRGRPLFFLTHEAMFDEPELTLDVLAVITCWSHCEYELSCWLADLLRTDARIAYGMLSALSGSESRRAALTGAAKTALSKADFALYERVEKEVRASRKLRNRFVHGLWGTMPNKLPGHLLLILPDDLTDNTLYWSKPKPTSDPYPRLDYSKVQTYNATDLRSARLDAESALILIRSLTWACRRSRNPTRAERRRELLNLLATSPADRRKSLQRSHLAPQRRLALRPEGT